MSVKALTYVEIDIDFCSLNHGVLPCQAAALGISIVPGSGLGFDFGLGSVNGFTTTDATLTGVVGGATFVPSAGDPILRRTGLSIVGATDYFIQLDVERLTARTGAATWQGHVFYATSGHAENGGFFKSFPETGLTDVGDRAVIEIDMSTLNSGGSDWITHTVTGIRFDFDNGVGAGSFIIHSVKVGHRATSAESTGTDKCFNSLSTCQDRLNFTNEPVTLRFAIDTGYLPREIDCIPNIIDANLSPSVVSLGKDLGQRGTLNVTFRDHRHSDTGQGYDKYVTERSYNPFEQGTYWGKFRARQLFLKGRGIRLIRGYLGDTLAEMETRHFIIESFNGPSPQGQYTILAQDVLKLADGDRAQAPMVSNGFLVSAISAADVIMTLSPDGIGDVEYPNSGFIAISGSEIVAFDRVGGFDAFTKILLSCNGADASTTFTDTNTGGSAHTWTAVGNAQIDTAQSKFGGASGLFDGTGDWVQTPDSADFALGSSDWTFDAWFNCTGASAQGGNIGGQGDAGITVAATSFFVGRTAANTIQIQLSNGSAITTLVGTTQFTNALNTGFHHVAAVRDGTTLRLFIDGVQEAVTTFTGSIPDSSESFTVGARSTGGGSIWTGWLDEVRLSVGVARWTENFTPPPRAYQDGDIVNITRAQLGTTAATHDVQDRAQLCLQYVGDTPADIIYDLFVNYAFIPAAYITLSTWQDEVNSFLQRLYGATIAEPTDVRKLVSELIEQAALALWWDDQAQQIRLKVLRSISTDAAIYDENNTLEGTLSVSDQPNLRISQVWTYYGQRNPLRPVDEPDNFRSTLATTNLQAETDEGQSAITKIFSRWIPAFGRDTAERLNDIQLGRFQTPPRRITLDVMRDSVAAPEFGGGYQVGSWSFQDALGAPALVPIQVTRVNPMADRFQIEAEEMLFEPLDPTDLIDRTIIIDSNILNVNLRTIHDGIFPAPVTGESPSITVTCIVEAGVIVGSSATDAVAFDVGTWPSGVLIHLQVIGDIRGAGGDGGIGAGSSGGNETPGLPGGTALYTRVAITLEDASGKIYGGGGGGGGGGYRGGGGGGGAGTLPGDGGAVGTSTDSPAPGEPGTQDAGGAGGDGGGAADADGGAGGNPGLPGDDGQNGPPGSPGAVGGAAGNAIDGLSFITQVGAVGDRSGPEVN